MESGPEPPSTEGADYAQRLLAKQGVWWKKVVPVQAPYRWNLRRQQLGRTLDVGCGIGRNLVALDPGSVGVDHNPDSVALACQAGVTAMTPDELQRSPLVGAFDGLLISHVIEHLDEEGARALLLDYLRFLRPGGKVFITCPQERGYASDPTHVRFTTGEDLVALVTAVGLVAGTPFSFPFPRRAGRLFVYNEFCLLSHRPG